MLTIYTKNDAEMSFNSCNVLQPKCLNYLCPGTDCYNAGYTDKNGNIYYQEITEMGMAKTIMHEVVLHLGAKNDNKGHNVTSEQLDDMITYLKAYSKNVLKKDLNNEDAAALALGSDNIPSSTFDQLKKQLQDKYHVNLTQDQLKAKSMVLSYKIKTVNPNEQPAPCGEVKDSDDKPKKDLKIETCTE